MPHFLENYVERVNDILHDVLGGTLFYKQEIVEVPGLLAGVLVTYDDVRDDTREIHDQLSWEAFLDRMSAVKPDWKDFNRTLMEQLATMPEKVIGGWEGRTIYFIKGGRHPDQWTPSKASEDVPRLLASTWRLWGAIIREEVNHLREIVPVGQEYFREFERMVRVVFQFLFRDELGKGRAQSRTEPENDGVEIRDLLFPNIAEGGSGRTSRRSTPHLKSWSTPRTPTS